MRAVAQIGAVAPIRAVKLLCDELMTDMTLRKAIVADSSDYWQLPFTVENALSACCCPLHAITRCSINGHLDVCEELVTNGADPNRETTLGGGTPWLLAAGAGYLHIVKFFFLRGQDINVVNRSGQTALMYVVYFRREEVVHYLSKNVRIDQINENGQTALDEALRMGHREIVQILMTYSEIYTLFPFS
ncbi:hypothetical protein GPALN_014594 [Globodera pallida]|nr:hypothetical protein GPALN_014594 [Globodera pallida]